MREATLLISDALHKGLRRQESESLNRLVLERCDGLVVSQQGLSAPRFTEFPLSTEQLGDAGVQTAYPFPQYFSLTGIDLLFTAIRIYSVDSNFNIADLTINGIEPNGAWQVADLGKGWIATNGACIVCDLAGDGNYTVFNRAVRSIAYHQGRVLIGGFDKFFSNAWLNYFSELTGERIDDFGDDIVYWTTVGMDDLDWFFSNTIPSLDLVERVLERNDYGFMRVAGSVVRIEPFAGGVLVGTNKQLIHLDAITSPVPTYSAVRRANIGVKAMGGSDYGKVVVDNKGVVHLIGQNIKRLGFEEFFKDATGLLVMFNDVTDEFYISTNNETYVLYGEALSRIYEQVTSVSNGYVLVLKSVLKA